MRVLIDNQPLTSAATSISEALSAARLNAQQRGRVVVEAILDGEPLSDTDLNDPPTSLTTAAELRFATAEPAELVESTLTGVAESLSSLKVEQSAAAELLTLGRMSEAMDRIRQALTMWDSVRQAVIDEPLGLLGLSVETLRVKTQTGERAMGEQVQGLANCLTEVKRAFGAEDWSGLADVLGYDLQDQADQWKDALTDLAAHIRSTSHPDRPEER